ncbi:MAG: hypothetical protein IIB08_01920 [Bacteroidetes bacterium]|nr:hypothetical protein [Bacteroidota bacterium]
MKQKAKELVDKFKEITHDNKEITLMSLRLRKKCALICVDEIIKQWEYIDTYLADFGDR